MKRFLLPVLVVLLMSACRYSSIENILGVSVDIDIDSIKSRGVLRVTTHYNSIDYFAYKGTSVGYQYELAKLYAEHLGVKLEIVAQNDYEQNIESLHNGSADIIATTIVVDTINERRFAFAEPYGRSRQVVVRRNDNTSPFVLDTIGVMANSFYVNTINTINDTAAVPIVIEQIADYDVEQLIQMVADNEIKQTLCVENIAKANQWYYSNIDISTVIGQEVDLAWGVRSNAVGLKTDIDKWLKTFKKTSKFKHIYRKYVIDPRDNHSSVQSVSADTYKADYADLVKKFVTDKRYDQWLISSIIYQESHFNPKARSWAGACGLMQLMPETAYRFGVSDVSDPEQNIEAGVRMLKWLDGRLVQYVPDSHERVKFVLAAYNVGLGHVMDAIRLAKSYGKNPQKWSGNVEVALLLKSNPSTYSNPLVKHGYCRGSEPVNYVHNVIERARNYRKVYKK
ncbi:MAG: transglycosylase SLT domain-containing protein [Marinilabiliaceae bacterium]|nr:transglycosylase SLT domain-containing protein [Marinilabiliaceae bacterium]